MIRNHRSLVYWLCQFVFWSVIFLNNTFWSACALPAIAGRLAVVFACASLVAILGTHVYRAFIHRRGWTKLSALQALPRAALASVLTGSVLGYLAIAIWMLLIHGKYHSGGPGWTWTLPTAIYWSAYVFLWSVVYFGVHYSKRSRQAELENLQLQVKAKEAQLQGLVSQLNPHFMFNCLNSLRSLIAENPERAQDMVTELSGLLRYALQSNGSATAPLETEMEMVQSYLRLENIRFEDRLSVEIDLQPETLCVALPRMLLQLLVENGVKHGIEKQPEGGRIRVCSRLDGGTLKVQVINSGQLLDPGGSTRIGLANAQERLRLLYGGAAELRLENSGSDSVLAALTVPVENTRS
jgi:hypothetical protein